MGSSSITSSATIGAASWKDAQGIARQLCGGLLATGLSIQWHEFQVLNRWAKSPGCDEPRLEICLNYSGAARLQAADQTTVELGAGQLAMFIADGGRPSVVRGSDSLHRFIEVQISAGFLRARCPGQLDLLKPEIQAFVHGEAVGFFDVQPMSTALLAMRGVLLDPPVSEMAQAPWYLAKVMELLAHTAYRVNETEDFFCHRHRRQKAHRVEHVRYLIERDLENPPSLEMLAKEVECSTFYLSRIFAEEAGMSMPKFLRMRRIERAAELLRSRRMNVTEAAMAVGYSSLSAFNKAFVEQMGCCPGLYPAVKIPGRKPEER